jgi:hypothetical protein
MKKSPLTTPLQKGGIITQTWEQILNLSPISNPNRWEMLAFVCLLSILLFPSFCFATPKEVTIFPQAARVTETTKVRLLPEGKDIRKAIISLPGRTDPDSFIAYPLQDKRLKIEDLIWRQGVREDDAKTKELRKRIKLLKDEKTG